MHRSSSHSIKFANASKLNTLEQVLTEYRRVGNFMIDKIWSDGYKAFNVSEDKLELPKYLDYNDFKIETSLAARLLSSLVTQLSSLLRGTIEKRRRMVWVRGEMIKNGESTTDIDELLNKKKYILTKPKFTSGLEISSKNMDIEVVDNKYFDRFVRLKCLGKEYGDIKIPIKLNKCFNKWNKRGKELGSILVSNKSIFFRFEIEEIKKTEGVVLGADQGLKTVVTLSDGNVTPETDKHGHSLDSICTKVGRKKKGSVGFRKAKTHRKNFIGWSINQLNFSGIKGIRLEEIKNINFAKRATRKMQAWTNADIRDKLKSACEENEVHFILQSSVYKSQRCSCCGVVRKANRKKKVYECKRCGLVIDSDLNAAKNHEINLPDIPFCFIGQKLNLGDGFLWKPTGLFDLDGSELKVPNSAEIQPKLNKNQLKL